MRLRTGARGESDEDPPMRRPTNLPLQRVGLALAAALAILPDPAPAQAPDRVRLADKKVVLGEIIATSPTNVEIRDQSKRDEVVKLPIEQVVDVSFSGEPEALRSARGQLVRDPASALDELAKIEKAELDGASSNVLAEVAYVTAAATGRKALVTGENAAAAEEALRGFLRKNPQSHHFFPTSELLGDLLVRTGKFDAAAAAYGALEKGPPAYRVRAATSKAGSLFQQKKYAEAEREYAAAAATPTDPKDEASARQKGEARTGQARCLTRQGKAADAVQTLQDAVREANPKDGEFLARAYAALGDAFRAAGKEQDAVIAFLTVDLVYNTVPESRAEALYNLVQLWAKADKPERSREARQSLETSYPNSRWTKSLAADGT